MVINDLLAKHIEAPQKYDRLLDNILYLLNCILKVSIYTFSALL